MHPDLMNIDAEEPEETAAESEDHADFYVHENEEEDDGDESSDSEGDGGEAHLDEHAEHHHFEDEDDDEDETDFSGQESAEDPVAVMMRHLTSRTGVTINGRLGDSSASQSRSGLQGKFDGIMRNLKSMDPSEQFMAVQELNEVMSMATEDSIGPGSGSGFVAESFIHALVGLISGEMNALGVENPELQLLACRCIENMLEAVPLPSTHRAIENSGVIGALCMKLASIEYIDVAEQSISLLSKLAADHKREILEHGGLTALLSFLDFFPISVQRIAVQCASNLLMKIPENMLELCVDSGTTLENLLQYSDQKLVEEACLAVCNLFNSLARSRRNQSAQSSGSLLQKVVTDQMLSNVIQLLKVYADGSAGSSSSVLLSTSTFVTFMKTLKLVSDESPALATKLLDFRVGDLLMILLQTDATESTKPSEQLIIFLDLAISFLPSNETDSTLSDGKSFFGSRKTTNSGSYADYLPQLEFPVKHQEYLDAESEADRASLVNFASGSIPILIDTFYSSINTSVRIKILITITRIVSLLSHDQLNTSLKDVQFAQFLARLLCRSLPLKSSHSHPGSSASSSDDVSSKSRTENNSAFIYCVISYGVLICDMLMKKMPECYRIFFVREGVVHELNNVSHVYGQNLPATIETALEEIKKRLIQTEAKLSGAKHDDESDEPRSLTYSERMVINKDITAIVKDFKSQYEVWYQCKLAEFASEIVRQNFDAAQYDKNPAAQLFQKAKTFANGLSKTKDMQGVLALFSGDSALTSFEFQRSGLLHEFLTLIQSDPSSVRVFIEAFMLRIANEDLKSSPLFCLIDRLNTCLVRVEPFEIVSPIQQSFNVFGSNSAETAHGNNFISLIRRIKFKLKPSPDLAKELEEQKMASQTVSQAPSKPGQVGADVLSASDSYEFLISVPSIAPMKMIEEVVLAKLSAYLKKKSASVTEGRRHRKLSSTKRRQDDPEPIDAGDDESEGEEEPHRSSRSHFERLRRDSSFVHDVDVNERKISSSTQNEKTISYSAAVTSIVSKWRLELKLDDLDVGSEMTAYGVVHRHETEMRRRNVTNDQQAGADIFTGAVNVFQNTFTLYYTPVPKSKKRQSDRSVDTFFQSTPKYQIPFIDVPYTKYMQTSDADKGEASFYDVLQFLRILYNLNSGRWRDFIGVESNSKQLDIIKLAPSVFVNKKITAKLERQLFEILILCSNVTPSWLRDICHRFNFLVPFESRLKFLHLTAFPNNRQLLKWLQLYSSVIKNSASEDVVNLSKISRQKVRIHRDKLFDSCLKIMETYARDSDFMMEIEYFDEVGTGLGPTLEFYATMSHEWQNSELEMWRNRTADACSKHVQVDSGLFPDPWDKRSTHGPRVLTYFRGLGQFVAKAIIDFRMLDLPLHPLFLKRAVVDIKKYDGEKEEFDDPKKRLQELVANVDLITSVDSALGSSLQTLLQYAALKLNTPNRSLDQLQEMEINGSKLSDLSLEFSLPGYPNVKCDATEVDMSNIEEYLEFVVDKTVFSGIEKQVCAFRNGFNTIFPISHLRALTMDELNGIIGVGPWEGKWQQTDIVDSIKFDHGFDKNSRPIQWLLDFMCSLDQQGQRLFVQFITGTPKLPIGGFKSLTPPFTIVKRTFDVGSSPVNSTLPSPSSSFAAMTADSYLPSVMTCVNYLKLPEYSTCEVMKQRLMTAIEEGQGSFHLS